MLKPWCIHRRRCRWSHMVFYHWESQLVWTSNLHRSKSKGNIEKTHLNTQPPIQICTSTLWDPAGRQEVHHRICTALIPFSCCAALSNTMVRSCQRTLRSRKSSQGFLAVRPARLFLSWLISSHSWSHLAPCSCFRAAHREAEWHKSWLYFSPHAPLLSSDQAHRSVF